MIKAPQSTVQRLVSGFGLSAIPIEQQREHLQKLQTILGQALTIRAINELSDDQKQEIAKLLEDVDDENKAGVTFWSYVEAVIPNVPSLLEEEVDKLIAGYDQSRLSRPYQSRQQVEMDSSTTKPMHVDPVADSPDEELAGAVTDFTTSSLDLLCPNKPDYLGADDLIADLIIGPNRVLSPRERKRWVAEKTISALLSISILIWMYILALIVARKLGGSDSIKGLPDWIPTFLPYWLVSRPFWIQILVATLGGILVIALITRLRIALHFRYSDLREFTHKHK